MCVSTDAMISPVFDRLLCIRIIKHDLNAAASYLAGLVHDVGEDQLAAESPCRDWTVSDLVQHIVGLSEAFTAAAEKRPTEALREELVGDWPERAAGRLSELAAAWRREDAWVGEAEAGGVRMAAAELAVVALDELVLHGWDLARATGQSFAVSEADAVACLTSAEAIGTWPDRGP